MLSRTHLSRGLLAAFFAVAGALHFVVPRMYERIVPSVFPNAQLLVTLSGAAELLGALGLLMPATRRASGWGLILLLIVVFPANVEMLQQARASGASSGWQAALWLRLPLQGVLIWWVWRVTIRTPQHAPNERGLRIEQGSP